jgi:hypothetical protein
MPTFIKIIYVCRKKRKSNCHDFSEKMHTLQKFGIAETRNVYLIVIKNVSWRTITEHAADRLSFYAVWFPSVMKQIHDREHHLHNHYSERNSAIRMLRFRAVWSIFQ